jgi:hypothetical protein
VIVGREPSLLPRAEDVNGYVITLKVGPVVLQIRWPSVTSSNEPPAWLAQRIWPLGDGLVWPGAPMDFAALRTFADLGVDGADTAWPQPDGRVLRRSDGVILL